MRKTVLSVVLIIIFSGALLIAADIPKGETVKVFIQKKTLTGELLSVTPELIVIRELEETKDKTAAKYIVLGCPVPETEVVKIQKRCGPIGNIFVKAKKFVFKKNTPAMINDNLVNLSLYALYGSLIPEHINTQLKIFGRN